MGGLNPVEDGGVWESEVGVGVGEMNELMISLVCFRVVRSRD